MNNLVKGINIGAASFFNVNLILKTDSYKISHHLMFPKGTEYTQYYVESRGGKYDKTMVAGVNFICNELAGGITVNDVLMADKVCRAHFGRSLFNLDGWMIIAKELGGKLPLRIRAVGEGLVIPVHNVLLTVENTDKRFGWLPGHFETNILRAIWYSTTVATESLEAKKIIKRYLETTTEDDVIPLVLPFRLHDFGPRGVSSSESSALGGSAHMYNFQGSDNLEACVFMMNMFGCDMPGFSIPASEHSVQCMYGEYRQDDYFNKMISFIES